MTSIGTQRLRRERSGRSAAGGKPDRAAGLPDHRHDEQRTANRPLKCYCFTSLAWNRTMTCSNHRNLRPWQRVSSSPSQEAPRRGWFGYEARRAIPLLPFAAGLNGLTRPHAILLGGPSSYASKRSAEIPTNRRSSSRRRSSQEPSSASSALPLYDVIADGCRLRDVDCIAAADGISGETCRDAGRVRVGPRWGGSSATNTTSASHEVRRC